MALRRLGACRPDDHWSPRRPPRRPRPAESPAASPLLRRDARAGSQSLRDGQWASGSSAQPEASGALTRSSPSSTRSRFDMSPMIRRIGNGSFLMSVGAATICSPARQDRLLVDVDDFQIVPALEILVADRAQVVDRTRRSWGHACDVEPKDVPFGRRCLRSSLERRADVAGMQRHNVLTDELVDPAQMTRSDICMTIAPFPPKGLA